VKVISSAIGAIALLLSAVALQGRGPAAQDTQGAFAIEAQAQDSILPRAGGEVTRTDSRVEIIRGACAEINSSATVIGRTTRSPVVLQEVRDILAETDKILRIVGPDVVEPPPTRPPPTGGGGGGGTPPPPTGAWIDPSKTGISQDPHTPLSSQFGWSLCSASPFTIYSAYDNTVLSTMYQGCEEPVELIDTWVKGLTDPNTGVGHNKWCVRCYDAGYGGDWKFEHCSFTDSKEEHGFYGNAIGGIRWYQCKFTRNGSQGIQIVGATPGSKRQHETRFWNPLDPVGSAAAWNSYVEANKWQLHNVVECSFEQVGIPKNSIGLQPGTRPAYAISMFEGIPFPVRIERCYLKTDIPWIDDNGVARTCFGAVMAHNRLRFELLDTYIYYRNGPMDSVQVWRCGDNDPATIDVLLRGDEIWANNRVDIRPRPGDRIVISGCKGDAPVMISYNEPYTWETSPGWDWGKVIYQGKITEDLDLVAQ
jgi:hypothetical protein